MTIHTTNILKTTIDEVDPRDEWAVVTVWRRDFASTLGFDRAASCELALSKIDLHNVEHLIEHGCPPETALAIVK